MSVNPPVRGEELVIQYNCPMQAVTVVILKVTHSKKKKPFASLYLLLVAEKLLMKPYWFMDPQLRPSCPVKQAHLVDSSRPLSVHLLFIDCICHIKCRILNSFYLNDVCGVGLAKLVSDFVVLPSISYRIQLEEMYGFFSSCGIAWLGNPIIRKLYICQEKKNINSYK